MKANVGEVRPLTGLRGLAALAIALYHFFEAFHPRNASMPVSPVSCLYLAVDIFFVMSGYVLALNYAARFAEGVSVGSWVRFIWQRIARVYPAYAVFTLIYAAKLLMDTRGQHLWTTMLTPSNISANALLLTSWGFGARAIVGPSWSISSELFCYLLFPSLMLLFTRRRWTQAMAVFASLAVIWWLSRINLGVSGSLDIVPDTFWPIVRAIAGFSIGAVIYLAPIPKFSTRVVDISFAIIVIMLLALSILRTDDLYKYPLLVLLVIFCSRNGQATEVILGNRALHYVGLISYSVYLAHAALVGPFVSVVHRLQHMAGETGSVAIGVVLYTLMLFAVGSFSYWFIELPGKRLFSKLLSNRQNKSVELSRV